MGAVVNNKHKTTALRVVFLWEKVSIVVLACLMVFGLASLWSAFSAVTEPLSAASNSRYSDQQDLERRLDTLEMLMLEGSMKFE